MKEYNTIEELIEARAQEQHHANLECGGVWIMNKRILSFGSLLMVLIAILWVIDYIIPIPISFIGYCIYQLVSACVIFMIFLIFGVIAVQIWNEIFYKEKR